MSKLFIIGNGFDIAHGVESKYEHFKQYLISQLEDVSGSDYSKYDFTDDRIINTDYSSTEENDILVIMYHISSAECWFRKKLNDIEWRTIENSVGELNFDEFSWLFHDEEDNEHKNNYINEDIVKPYVDVLAKIPNYFADWIKQINLSGLTPKNNFKSLFDEDTLFLCFNYTSTLESLYKINNKNICYIHGNADNDDEIFFGHGNNRQYDYYEEQEDINSISVAELYSKLNDVLRKPVIRIIRHKEYFFKSLYSIDSVYSIGFSYSKVDEPYIKAINDVIPQHTKWFIHSFPATGDKARYKNTIANCDYKGIVEEFDC